MKKISRQRKWQLIHQSKGLCVLCNEPSITKSLCLKHLKLRTDQGRTYYRKKHGIPIDAPLLKPGRPRLYK